MASESKICDIDPEVVKLLQKFRLRKEKTTAAISLKIVPEKLLIVLDDQYKDISIEELAEEIPSHKPSYLVYSYVLHHDDGRVSYPLIFIFVSPAGSKPELQMMYAGSKLHLVKTAGFSKVFEVRSTEELTEEWLKNKLGFSRS